MNVPISGPVLKVKSRHGIVLVTYLYMYYDIHNDVMKLPWLIRTKGAISRKRSGRSVSRLVQRENNFSWSPRVVIMRLHCIVIMISVFHGMINTKLIVC